MNDPKQIAQEHGHYLEFARFGYIGATLLSKWYERNIRLFSNLKRVTELGDRVLVIFGAEHAAILRHLIQSDPDMVLVEACDYL